MTTQTCGSLRESIPANGGSGLPLSFAQQRLWFMEKLEPGNVAYNLPFGLWFTGQLDVKALEFSLDQVVRRHETLRTSFSARHGEAIQIIHDAAPVLVRVMDLREMPQPEREQKLESLVREDAERPFNLEQAPLLRVQLVRVAEEQCLLLGNMHHIISDGWSIGILLREISRFYSDFLFGSVTELPALPVQYSEFAASQHEWLKSEIYSRQLEYWKNQLAGIPLLDFPTDRPRPAVRSHKGGCVSLRLSDALADQLKALCRQEKVTLFMALLAAFQAVLSRYTGESDVPVGTAIANRNSKELRGLIGFFANTLVMRASLDGNPAFREILRRVQGTALTAYRNQDVPFDKLVQELQPARDLSRTPLFQVMLLLQNVDQTMEMPGVRLEKFTSVTPAAKFDLTLQVLQSAAGIDGELSYSSELFEARTAGRVVRHFQTLLESAAKNPDCALSDLCMLTETDRQELLYRRNETSRDLLPHSMADIFEFQAEQTPAAIAVEHEQAKLTYFELNRQANSLAHYLKKLGAGPETLVGICLERGLDMVIGLLAIMKAGAAYVPLDPGYPRERLRYMVEDSTPAVLLTQESIEHPWDFYRGRAVRIEKDRAWIEREAQNNPERAGAPESLCYVIYTSGSTGKPKGVQITNRALTNFIFAMRERPGIAPEDVLLAETPISFDIAGLEIYLPLSVGARIRILGRTAGANGVLFARELAEGVTMVQATPASWQIALETGYTGNNQLKVLCGGEALSAELARKLISRSGSVWNMYGPTETTIWSLVEELKSAEAISIGRPILNTTIYVLDSRLHPVPEGVAGELYIGGHGLARGYWRRQDLTAERFLPDPFSLEIGGRMYRTGDLVRWRNDATLEFLGRTDHQVKVFGHRVELGEVEAAIAELDGVAQAAVIAHEDGAGEKRLVAYVVPALKGTEPVSIERLRASLKQKLPAYMVPSGFILLEKLPLSPAGKVNRHALPKPTASAKPENYFPDATTSLQKEIAALWCAVLDIDSVGIDDNFFDVGGDSFRSLRLHNLMVQSLNLKIDLMELFKSPTVRAIAEYLEQRPDCVLPGVPLKPALNAGKQRLRKQLVHRQVQ